MNNALLQSMGLLIGILTMTSSVVAADGPDGAALCSAIAKETLYQLSQETDPTKPPRRDVTLQVDLANPLLGADISSCVSRTLMTSNVTMHPPGFDEHLMAIFVKDLAAGPNLAAMGFTVSLCTPHSSFWAHRGILNLRLENNVWVSGWHITEFVDGFCGTQAP